LSRKPNSIPLTLVPILKLAFKCRITQKVALLNVQRSNNNIKNQNFVELTGLTFHIFKVRYVARSIHERTTRVIGLNFIYLLMFNNDSTKHVCTRERKRVLVTEGHTLVQVKGSRDSLLCNVHVCKPCMQYLKHTCEYKCVC